MRSRESARRSAREQLGVEAATTMIFVAAVAIHDLHSSIKVEPVVYVPPGASLIVGLLCNFARSVVQLLHMVRCFASSHDQTNTILDKIFTVHDFFQNKLLSITLHEGAFS